jgi:hypothetical protein
MWLKSLDGLLYMRLWHMTLVAPGIGIALIMTTYLRLESVVCQWKPLDAHDTAWMFSSPVLVNLILLSP